MGVAEMRVCAKDDVASGIGGEVVDEAQRRHFIYIATWLQ
jgi:hypothetical protein